MRATRDQSIKFFHTLVIHQSVQTIILLLRKDLHKEVCNNTFNSITVDGEMSTNDSFIGVCSVSQESKGRSKMISRSTNHWPSICQAYEKVCNELAAKIVEDGEGATRIVELKVEQAFSSQDADRVARGG